MTPQPIAQPNTELGAIAGAVLDDHTELDQMVPRLRDMCRALCEGRDLLGPAPAVLIEEFESELIPHFAAEQAEEFLGSLVTEQPHLLRQVERLQQEHIALAEALDQLLEFARQEQERAELGVRLGQFLDSFEAHECDENALMHEFLLLDELAGN